MKFFVTGVGGQLGHDVMNELIRRGHEGVGSDIQEQYSGVEDGSEVTKAPYLSLDITDKEAVKRVIESGREEHAGKKRKSHEKRVRRKRYTPGSAAEQKFK